MNPVAGLMYGFGIALTPDNVVAALSGALLGTAVGILPGLGPTVVLALLLGPTMRMKTEAGLIMLGAIYYGTQYGDSMSAILMNVPSEAPSVVIAIDGYKAARRGRAGAALSVAAMGSFLGASIGLVGLAVLAGPLSQAALAFGPPEYFVITVVGLLVLSKISSTSPWRGLTALGLGLALTTIGIESITGRPRFTFGVTDLMEGVDVVPAVMGLIGMAEMIHMAAKPIMAGEMAKFSYREIFPTFAEWKEAVPASLRGSVLGFFCGLLPGPTMTLATFASYRLERLLSPHTVGKGALRAVAGPKAADDGAISGTLVPLMGLGIPFTSVTAVLFAGLLLHGVTPGPLLIVQRPDLFWGLVAAMYVGNVALLILNFPLVGMWVSVLKIPQSVLSAMLVVLMLIGAYSLRSSVLDMAVVIIMGAVGYAMKQLDYERTLVILGLVLGPMLETAFARSLEMSGGDLNIFIERRIPQVLWTILVAIMIGPYVLRMFKNTFWPPNAHQGGSS
jgi:putative tricarboxylic transport membrane protein